MNIKRFFTSPVFFLILAVACYFASSQFRGHSEETVYSKDAFPAYGSEAQDSLDGWVYFDATSLESVGNATQTNYLNNSIADYTYHDLYLVQDDQGNRLIYDKTSTGTRYMIDKPTQLPGIEEPPMRLYGHLTDFDKKFSSFNGYKENLSMYSEYPLLIESTQHSVRQFVQAPKDKTLENAFLYASILMVVLAVVMRIRPKNR